MRSRRADTATVLRGACAPPSEPTRSPPRAGRAPSLDRAAPGREDDAMAYATISYERRDAVALITLNRPDRLNAWTPQMASEQAAAIRAANEDAGVGAIVMTGAGRGFCAGADMRDTFGKRLDGVDPAGDGGESGGMPADVDWVA